MEKVCFFNSLINLLKELIKKVNDITLTVNKLSNVVTASAQNSENHLKKICVYLSGFGKHYHTNNQLLIFFHEFRLLWLFNSMLMSLQHFR